MKNFNRVLVAGLLFCTMSMWGCTQQKTGAISTKIRELEARYTKLEEDYKTLQAAHEQHRKRLNQAETQRAALEKDKADLTTQLEATNGEREALAKQVSQRTVERDAAQNNLVQFSKELQGLVGRVESTLNSSSSPNVSIVPASRRTE
jgi:chromosome segregation ATPase